ncbi:MAG: fasciclin domain-containing protein [Aggregatilineales bacterium]
MRKVSICLIGLLMMLSAVIPAFAQEGTILDVAVGNSNFSTLVAAVQAADPAIAQALSGPGPLTVFAPTNQAFQNLDTYLQNNFDITLDDVIADQELLTNILLYHVVQGSVFSGQVAGLDGQVVPTLYPGTGIGITVNDDGSITLNGVADVVIADVAATNGVVHAIDNVIFNSVIVADIEALAGEVEQARIQAELGNSAAGVAASDPSTFSTLLAVVQASGELPLLNEGLNITVFAPTNAAFDELLAGLGMSAEDLLANTELLSTVIRYHVVPGIITSADMVAEGQGSFRTFLNRESRSTGDEITFDVVFASFPAGGIELNGSAVISAVDIEADNGIVHVVDEVLIPNEVREALGLPLNPSADDMAMDMGSEEDMTEMDEEEVAAEDDMSEEMMGNTIADIVVASAQGEEPEFTLLLEVVMAADPSVLDALSGEGPLTVFAPTDAAFEALLEVLGLPVDAVLTQGELLTSVLLYHVVPGEVLEDDVVALDGQDVATLLGEDDTIFVTVTEDGVVLNDTVNVISTNIMADNGIVHVIDGVLLPASVRALLGM